jgi:hypothetical protein
MAAAPPGQLERQTRPRSALALALALTLALAGWEVFLVAE